MRGSGDERVPTLKLAWPKREAPLAFLAFVAAAPLFATRYLPFTDLPEHVAATATIARLLPGGEGAPYVVAFAKSQYLLHHLAGALLTRVLGDALLATRLLLAAAAIGWAFSFRRLVRALGRDDLLAYFAPMVFWNRALVIGFVPYVASIPIAMFALALAIENAASPTRRRTIVLGVVALLLFYEHASTYVMFVVIAAAVTATLAVRALRSTTPDAGRPRRALVTFALAIAPSAVAALAWSRTGALGASEAGVRTPMVPALRLLPSWTFDVWRGHGDEAAALLWWGALTVLLAIDRFRAPPPAAADGGRTAETPNARLGIAAVLPFGIAALVYFAMPFQVGAAYYLNVRLAPIVSLFALLLVRPLGGLQRRLAARLSIAAVAAATVFSAGLATFEMRRTAEEMLGDFDPLLAKMAPGAKVALLDFESRSARIHYFPYLYAGAYHRAKYGGIGAWSFSTLDHWSVHHMPGAEPPKKAGMWIFEPCAYRYRVDGAFYDYLLVQGSADKLRARAVGPRLVPLGTAGAFTLLEVDRRERGESGEDDADRGPCERDAAAR